MPSVPAEDADVPKEPDGTGASGEEEPGGDWEEGETAVLYIGTRAGGFTKYPFTYDEILTPEFLILKIEELTGWNLPLADTVYTGEGGNPDALDIYYFMEGNQPLELPALGLKWPLDQPYLWEGAESME